MARKKQKSIGQRAIAAMEEALAHARGEPTPGLFVHEPVDVAAIRKASGLSQTRFATTFGLDISALRDWEQGRRAPDRAARVLLRVIERAPDVVAKTVAA